jgi:hypothetical protein
VRSLSVGSLARPALLAPQIDDFATKRFALSEGLMQSRFDLA